MPYGWLTFAAGRQQLARRLADPSNVFWLDAELGTYIVEALRVWNALTFTWKQAFACRIAAAQSPTWYSLGTMDGSPRSRTLSDGALYTAIQYHLLEPAFGGVWSGTSQFSMPDVSLALQRCRDELIQLVNCNAGIVAGIGSTPGTRTVTMPDTVLDVMRARWMPKDDIPSALVRTDTTALGYYQPDYLQTPNAQPTQYNIATVSPLQMQVDIPPAVPGTYEVTASLAGTPFAPPASTPLAVPDDLAWMLKWGALGDLLSRDSEATDLLRAQWCKQRYADALKVAEMQPWIMQASINEVPAYIVSMAEMDRYAPGWDTSAADYTSIVIGGMDFFTVVPDSRADLSLNLTVLGNAPVPVNDFDPIQCGRDEWDALLDYAQFLAAWKQGGAEFQGALPLEQRFYAAAKAKNAHLEKLGLFVNLFEQEGQRQDREQERYPSGD